MEKTSQTIGKGKGLKKMVITGVLFVSTIMFTAPAFCCPPEPDIPGFTGHAKVLRIIGIQNKNVVPRVERISKQALSQACPPGKIWYVKGRKCIDKFD